MEEGYKDGGVLCELDFGAELPEVGDDCVDGLVGGSEEGQLHEDLDVLIRNVHPRTAIIIIHPTPQSPPPTH